MLRGDVLMMKDLTERIVANAAKGLFERDTGRSKIAIADDEEIDLLEMQVDRDGIELLTRFTPVAGDMRNVVSAMKIGTNLERVGDQAVGIARRACKLNDQPRLELLDAVHPLYLKVLEIIQNGAGAFVEEDLDLAGKAVDQCLGIHELASDLTDQLTEEMTGTPERAAGYVNLLFVVRNLERMGELGKNIAEDAVFATGAKDIRHLSARRVAS